jgi:hypothetical protein
VSGTGEFTIRRLQRAFQPESSRTLRLDHRAGAYQTIQAAEVLYETVYVGDLSGEIKTGDAFVIHLERIECRRIVW